MHPFAATGPVASGPMPASHTPDPSDPESVGAATFDTRRRGFDPMQVRAYLTVVSRELQRLREREREREREELRLSRRRSSRSLSRPLGLRERERE